MQVQTFREPDSTSPRYPRKPKSTKFCDILAKKSVWQLQNSLFSIKSSSGVDSPEDTRRRSISVALPNSSPVKRYDQKAVPIHHTSNDENKRHYCGALLNFANVDLKTMPRIWTACTDTNGEPAFLLPNFRQVIAASFFFFFGSWYWSNISGKKKKKKAGRLSICCLVHNQHRVKIHIQIRDIERNIPNQPLWQHLGWLRSYNRIVWWIERYDCICPRALSSQNLIPRNARYEPIGWRRSLRKTIKMEDECDVNL